MERIFKYAYLKHNPETGWEPEVFPGENHKPTIETKEIMLFCRTPTSGQMFIPISNNIEQEPGMPFSQMFMDKYAHDLLYGSGKDHIYDYNGRLRHWGGEFLSCDGSIGIDQVEYMVDKLSKSSVSRRAIGTTWYPQIDTAREDVPCLQLVQCDIREGLLNLRVVFRSEDMGYGLGPNMYGLVQLQVFIANRLNLPVGSYTHVAFCPHLYPRDGKPHLRWYAPSGWYEQWQHLFVN
jgi:thymidylate synthase